MGGILSGDVLVPEDGLKVVTDNIKFNGEKWVHYWRTDWDKTWYKRQIVIGCF